MPKSLPRSRRRCVSLIFLAGGLVLLLNGYVLDMLSATVASQANYFTDWRYQEGGLFGDLLPPDASCRSRTEQKAYYKATKHRPSASLISRLRSYASHHAECTQLVSNLLDRMEGSTAEQRWQQLFGTLITNSNVTDCRFLVWIQYSGLGNNLVSIASAFLYSLLTNRVLLIGSSGHLPAFFCEPFSGSSWVLSHRLPQDWLQQLNETHPLRHGQLVSSGSWETMNQKFRDKTTGRAVPFAYIHLTHSSNCHDNLFFDEIQQQRLASVSWLFIRSNQYFAPALYAMDNFHSQLQTLFPQPDTVFHLLARYLFHPANQIWEVVTRYFDAYLRTADRRVGLQLRTFGSYGDRFDYVSEQALLCGIQNRVLPNVSFSAGPGSPSAGRSSQRILSLQRNGVLPRAVPSKTRVTVFVTSLKGQYHDELKHLYLQGPTENGEVVSLHQLSREGEQNSESKAHNMLAWTEILLLSLSDELITSSWSTFGYSAQGLAGVQPYVLSKGEDGSESMPLPVCFPSHSMEPCFHAAPLVGCTSDGGFSDFSADIPFIRHCEDVPWGVKSLRLNQKH